MGGACPDMVEGCSYDPGLRWAGVIVRVVGVFGCTSAARFSSGIVRLVESQVKPPRRNTKARRGCAAREPWHYHRMRPTPRRQ